MNEKAPGIGGSWERKHAKAFPRERKDSIGLKVDVKFVSEFCLDPKKRSLHTKCP